MGNTNYETYAPAFMIIDTHILLYNTLIYPRLHLIYAVHFYIKS